MSKRKNRKQQRDKPMYRLPWKAIEDTVYDADGNMMKAPHECSWEGDGYLDDSNAAAMIVEAVNNYFGNKEEK